MKEHEESLPGTTGGPKSCDGWHAYKNNEVIQ
jgi:hypothetical protein